MGKKNKSASAAPATDGDVTSVEVITSEPQKEVVSDEKLYETVMGMVVTDMESNWKLSVGNGKKSRRTPEFSKAEIRDGIKAVIAGNLAEVKAIFKKANANPTNSEFYGFYKAMILPAVLVYLGRLVGVFSREDEIFCRSKTPGADLTLLTNMEAGLVSVQKDIAKMEGDIKMFAAEIMAGDATHAKEYVALQTADLPAKKEVHTKLVLLINSEKALADNKHQDYFQGSHMVWDVMMYHHIMKDIQVAATVKGYNKIATMMSSWIASKKWMQRKSDGESVDHVKE